MGKRKSRESDYVQQQCDVWLTAPEKPKNSQKKQRILSLHAVNIIGSRPLTFEPTKSSSNKTKQSQLMSFFKPKTVSLQQISSDISNENDNTKPHQMHNKRTNQTQVHYESQIPSPVGTTSKSPAKQSGNVENIPVKRNLQYGNIVKTSRNLAGSSRSTESLVELQSKQYSAVASAPAKCTKLDFSQNYTNTMNSSSQSPQEKFGKKHSINSDDENSTPEGLNLSKNFSDQYLTYDSQQSVPDLSNIGTCSFEDGSASFQKVSKEDFDLADTFEESNLPEINNTCDERYSQDYTGNKFKDCSFVNNSQNSRIEFSPINTQKLQASFISGNRSTFVSKGVCARNISFNSNMKGLDDFSDVSGQTFSENQVTIKSLQRNRVKGQEAKGHTYSRSEVNDLEMSGTGFKRSEDEQRTSCMWKKNSKRTEWLNDFEERFDRESFGDTQLSKEKSQCESKMPTELEECGKPCLSRTKESGFSNSDLNDSDLLSCSIEQNTLECSEFKENLQSTNVQMSLGSDSFRTQDGFRDCFKRENRNTCEVERRPGCFSSSIEQNTLSQCIEFKENMQSPSVQMSLGSDSFRTQDVFRDVFKRKNRNTIEVERRESLSSSIEQNTLSQCIEFNENLQSTSVQMLLGSDSFRTQDVFRDCFNEDNKNTLDLDSEFGVIHPGNVRNLNRATTSSKSFFDSNFDTFNESDRFTANFELTSQLVDDDLELTDCSQKSPSKEQLLPNTTQSCDTFPQLDTFPDFSSQESSHKRVDNESQSYFVSTHQSELLLESDKCDFILDTQDKASTDFELSSEFASQQIDESDSFLINGAVSDTDDDNDSQDFGSLLSPQITQDSIGIYKLK